MENFRLKNEIQKRLEDKEWDKKIARSTIQKIEANRFLFHTLIPEKFWKYSFYGGLVAALVSIVFLFSDGEMDSPDMDIYSWELEESWEWEDEVIYYTTF